MFDEILIFSALGILAGLLAGMFGIGGGLIIVPVLIGTFTSLGFDNEVIVHLSIGTAIACIIFTGLSSANAHKNKNSINFIHFKPVAIGIIFGALIGALFAIQIKGLFLKYLIAVFILLVGFQLLFNISLTSKQFTPTIKASGLNLTSAIGTSAACGVPIAIFGTLGYIIAGINKDILPTMSLGYIYLPALLGVSITSIFSAKYGADIAHYLSQSVLRKLMAVWFFIVSIYMFLI